VGDVSPTPSQTVGPFFDIGFRWLHTPELVELDRPGAMHLGGQILDGNGDPVPDAVVEIFQADDQGRFPPDTDPAWSGFGRCLCDGSGRYHFLTVKPGPVAPGVAPHIDVSVFARGLLQRVVTRCYFGDEAPANAADPLLRSIDGDRATTLVAVADADGYRFDVHLQGERETAFFAW
jgi:protocatechuate 3,4-dioxygenase alpha subunit